MSGIASHSVRAETKGSRWFPWVLWSAFFGIVALLTMPPVLRSTTLVSAGFFFATGWFQSGQRLIQGFRGGPAPGWWLLGCVLFVVLAHGFLASLQRGQPRGWRLRASLAAVGICWMAVFAGMSLAGTVHQVGWLFGSREPWAVRTPAAQKRKMSYALDAAAMAIAGMQLKDRQVDSWLAEWKLADAAVPPVRCIGDSHGMLQAIYIWPRKMSDFREVGGYVVTTDGTITPHPYERMQALLSKPD